MWKYVVWFLAVGLDVQSTFTPVYTGPKRVSLTRTDAESPNGSSPEVPLDGTMMSYAIYV